MGVMALRSRTGKSMGSRISDQPLYQLLKRKSHWIASAPGVFFWAGEHSVLAHGLAICQQVPKRVYVGLEQTELSGAFRIELADAEDGSGLLYNQMNASFDSLLFPYGEWQFTPFVANRLIGEQASALLQELASYLGLHGRFRIRVLSELRPGAGLAWSGAFAAALIGGLFAAAGRLRDNPWTYPWVNNPILAEVSGWAWELERWLQGGSASGYGTLCALVKCATPQIYTIAVRGHESAGRSVADEMHSPRHLIDILTARTNPVIGDGSSAMPASLDYCLVYTGVGKSTAASIARVSSALPAVLEAAMEAAHSVPSALPWLDTKDTSSGAALNRILVEGVHTSTLRVLGEVVQAMQHGSDGEGLQGLAAAIDAVAGGLSQIGLSWPHAELIRAAVVRSAWPDISHIGLKPTGGGHGGSVFFVYPRMTWGDEVHPGVNDIPATRLLHELESLKAVLGPNVSLDWCSSRDGFEGGGLELSLGLMSRPL